MRERTKDDVALVDAVDPSLRIDCDGRILAVDAAAAELLHTEPERLLGLGLGALTGVAGAQPEPIDLVIVPLARPDADGAHAVAYLRDLDARELDERLRAADTAVLQAFADGESPGVATQRLLAVLADALRAERAACFALGPDAELELVAASPDDAAATVDSAAARLAGRALLTGELTLDDTGALAVGLGAGERPRSVVVLSGLSGPIPAPATLDVLADVAAQAGELLAILQERHSRIESLARLALTDELTGLPNRRAWDEMLARELARASRDGQPVCVAVLDLDEFKRFNDAHGHQAGDQLLRDAASAWQRCLRLSDLLARYGGEEFAAIIPAWPLPTAEAVIERVRQATPGALTASAGIASWDGRESGAQLFGRADAALYAAKQAGRDRTVTAESRATPPPVPPAD